MKKPLDSVAGVLLPHSSAWRLITRKKAAKSTPCQVRERSARVEWSGVETVKRTVSFSIRYVLLRQFAFSQ